MSDVARQFVATPERPVHDQTLEVPGEEPTPNAIVTDGPAFVAAPPAPAETPRLEEYAAQEKAAAPALLPRATYLFGYTRRDLRHAAGLTTFFLLAALFLFRVQAILPPFVIAFALAALLDPYLRHWEARGRSRTWMILMLYLLTLLTLALIVRFVVPAARDQIDDIIGNLDRYSKNLEATANAFMKTHQTQLRFLGIRQHKITDLYQSRTGPVQTFIAGTLGGVTGIVQNALGKMLWLIIIPVAGFFLMRDYPILRAKIILLFPDRYHDRLDTMSQEIVCVFSAYVRGLAKICACYAVTMFVIFSLLGERYALFLALLAGTFYAVPYVGQLITATSAGVVAYLMDAHTMLLFFTIPAHSLAYAALVVAGVVTANNIFDQVVYPRIVGGSVGLHPVATIFALMSGATLFGIWGMLLATPVAASIQIVLMCFFPKLKQIPPARLLQPQDASPGS